MRNLHLFAGSGGGLLADLILGHTPIGAVELDPYCCAVLRERAADGWFPELRVHEGDVRLFDPSEYAGRVDCIHAGFPCQDVSNAGSKTGVGIETRSGLYREALRVAGVVRSSYLFFENVSAIVTNGLATVIADLASIGYVSEWLCLLATDVGAWHERERWFCIAYSDSERKLQQERGKQDVGERFAYSSEDDADVVLAGLERYRKISSRDEQEFPPLAVHCGGPLNPDWCEWFMGFPVGFTELKGSEMHRFQSKPRSRGESSEDRE